MRRGRFAGWAPSAVSMAILTTGCGSSGDVAGAPDTVGTEELATETVATVAGEPTVAPPPDVRVYLRPVLQCFANPDAPVSTGAASDPTAQEVLGQVGGGSCFVGPQLGTGAVFEGDATAEIINGSWGVTVSLLPGVAGEDIWNAVAAECYAGSEVCPGKQLAIVIDGRIVSAPTVNAEFLGQCADQRSVR